MAAKTVIVGIDGSPASTRAARVGCALARCTRGECRLVHVVADTWLSDYAGQPPQGPRRLLGEVVREARERVAESLGGAVPAAARVGLEARVGRTAVVLRTVAEEQQAAYVVVGGKHHSAVGRALGASTAHDLVRTLDRPLVVVGGRDAPIRRVLAAVDLSAASRPTIAAARRLARLMHAELRIVHVLEPVRVPLTLPFALDAAEIGQRAERAFERLERAAPAALPGEWVLRRGHSVDAIAHEVTEWGADVLVVGSHGRGWVDRVLMGSATERLLGALPTTLLVVPTARRPSSGRLPHKAGIKGRRPRRKREVMA